MNEIHTDGADKSGRVLSFTIFKRIFFEILIYLAVFLIFQFSYNYLFSKFYFHKKAELYLGTGLWFSPDGERLITSINNCTFRTWEIKNLKELENYCWNDIPSFSEASECQSKSWKYSIESSDDGTHNYLKDNESGWKRELFIKEKLSQSPSVEYRVLDNNADNIQLLFCHPIEEKGKYKFTASLYDLEKSVFVNSISIPLSENGSPGIIIGGSKAFLFFSSLKIINVRNSGVKTIGFERDPWPYNVSRDGTLAVWFQKGNKLSKAVVYDVEEERVISEIPLESYGGGVQSIAINPQHRLIAVGYQKELETDSKIVTYGINNRSFINEVYVK